MSKDKNLVAILLAILAAALYAISTPVSKVMLQTVAPTMVAAFLYLGAGIGMGAMMLVRSGKHRTTEEWLHRSDIPYAVAMVVLDIAALLSILLLGESVTMIFIIASILMAAGCWIAAK